MFCELILECFRARCALQWSELNRMGRRYTKNFQDADYIEFRGVTIVTPAR